MFGDGTGGLSIWSLKNPEHPSYVRLAPRPGRAARRARPGRHARPASTRARTRPSTPRASSSSWRATRAASATAATRTAAPALHRRRQGPVAPAALTYHWVPAGHTATCINDCRYLWTVGPANNGSHAGQPQDIAGVLHPEWRGVPVFVTDVRDPITRTRTRRRSTRSATTTRPPTRTASTSTRTASPGPPASAASAASTRSACTTTRRLNADRYATATDPVPYAGGSVHVARAATYATNSLEHNSFHVTQAASDNSLADGHDGGRADVQQDRPAVRHAGERRQLHLDQRRRLRPLRHRRPRRQLRRQGLGPGLSDARTGSSCRARQLLAEGQPGREPERQLLRALVHGPRRHGRDRVLRPGRPRPRPVRPDRHQAGRLLPDPGRGLGRRRSRRTTPRPPTGTTATSTSPTTPAASTSCATRPDQGRRAAAGLLERLRQVAHPKRRAGSLELPAPAPHSLFSDSSAPACGGARVPRPRLGRAGSARSRRGRSGRSRRPSRAGRRSGSRPSRPCRNPPRRT